MQTPLSSASLPGSAPVLPGMSSPAASGKPTPWSRLGLIGLGLLALVLLPQFVANPYYLHLVQMIAIYSILLFGLDIVVGYTGEVSLGHAGLFGIGAYTAGVVAVKLGLPVYLALPAAIGVSSLFGLLLALPALRVTGPYLAMVTLAFGTIVQILINEMGFLTNGPEGLTVMKPVLFGHKLSTVGYYYLVIAMLAVALLVVHRMLKSHIGRAFEALRGSAIAADCMGVSVYRYKVLAFAISAAFAGLAGGLYSYSEEYISPNTYNFELTILFLLAIILGGRKTRSGALLGATIVVMLPNLLSDIELFRKLMLMASVVTVAVAGSTVVRGKRSLKAAGLPIVCVLALTVFAYRLQEIAEHRLTLFGLLILGVVYLLPDGIMGFVRGLLRQYRPQWVTDHDISHERGDDAHVWATPDHAVKARPLLLRAQGIVMQFGGLKALNEVELAIRPGTVHGLIGPNGSGKSTMMNVLTGIYQPTRGAIAFNGEAITGWTSSQIALSGIARTFQNIQLFGDMTALENVLVGLHHTYRSNLLDVILRTPRYRREEQQARLRAASILSFIGLSALANEEAKNLPYGKQRVLEIGRALGLAPSLLLLDEPAAGLTAPDIEELVAIIGKIREHGITVMLIEHHLDVVMGVSDTVSVLDFGQKIAEGTPAEIQANDKVVAAYLGAGASH